MKLTIEPTKHFFMVAGGAMVRMWTGQDDNGQPIVALLSGVIVEGGQFAEGLVEIPPPGVAEQRAWADHIMAQTSIGGASARRADGVPGALDD
jgi:hypothetical protein